MTFANPKTSRLETPVSDVKLKQKILKEIKAILNEQEAMPGSFVPIAHQNYLRQLARDVNKAAGQTIESGTRLIASMNNTLQKGGTTEDWYAASIRLAPQLKQYYEAHPRPKKYKIGDKETTSSQARGAAKSSTSSPSTTSNGVVTSTYFICRMPEEVEATKNLQKSKGLTIDAKIGKNTYNAILADKSIMSGGVPFAEKKLSLQDILKSRINQESLCAAIAGTTTSANITGSPEKLDSKVDPTLKTSPELVSLKCPSFIKKQGPYSYDEIKSYVDKYLTEADRLKIGDDVVNVVRQALDRNPTAANDCSFVDKFIKQAIKQKGIGISGLSKIETPEQEKKSSEQDALNHARTAKAAGLPLEELPEDVQVVAKKYGIYKSNTATNTNASKQGGFKPEDIGTIIGTKQAPFNSIEALNMVLNMPGASQVLNGKTLYYKDLAGNVQSKTVGTKQNPTFTEGEIISQKYIEKDGKTYMQVQVKSSDGKVYTGEAPFRGDPQFARDSAAKDARSKMPPRSLEETKNWIKRAKENAASSLFERLVKDSTKKKVL